MAGARRKRGAGAKRRVVLSVEQALAMPYATLRFVHLGWRVIRIEPTPVPGQTARGDPNRYIGRPVAGADRHSYYVAPNVGKEAIALNLKEEEGRALLHRLLRELPADVFCTNTLPAHLPKLGIDYERLRRERADLVWCGISAMGAVHPEVPGYDPMVQALVGYMDLTGDPAGPPLLCGLPIVDLKAGDEAFAQTILALMERAETGRGRMIDISMARVAASWLHTFLPMLDMGSPPEELRRSGNEHRQFIPVNAYRTADGFIFVAIGSDGQWRRFTEQPFFAALRQERFATNEGRRQHKAELHAAIEEITRAQCLGAVAEALAAASVPHAPITPLEEVSGLPFLQDALLRTRTPAGATVRLPPPAVPTAHLDEIGGVLPFPPRYGEETDAVLAEAGVAREEIASLRARGIIA
ncbi:MAG: CoA transferase [Planctomycetes bacterium]|nr:CoA transferase [Planctomycetota bacterium]